MAIETEADWLACVDPHSFVKSCQPRVRAERFRGLHLRWLEKLEQRMTDTERSFLAVYKLWLTGGCVGPLPATPVSDFDYFPHGQAPREYIESAFELLSRNNLLFALLNLVLGATLDFPALVPVGPSLDPNQSHKKKSKKGRQEADAVRKQAEERSHRERAAHRERMLWQFANEFRDVAGNPFRPVAFDPAWRSETVVGMAVVIDEEGAYERLPILADALEEAGCTDSQVLMHARDPGTHVRGCWLIDMILGRW